MKRKLTRHTHTGKKEIVMVQILILLLFITAQIAQAQGLIKVKLHKPPPNRLAVKDLWNLTLTNTSRSEIKITLEGTVDEAKDGRIVEGRTGAFTLKANETKRLTADNIPGGGTYSWSNNKYKEAILRTGSAPSGSYTICIYAKSEEGQQLAMDCIQHNIEMMSPPTLVTPADGETIPEGQTPIFTWLPSMPAPREAKYTLKIVEIIGNQSPDEAMQKNAAWFEKSELRTTTFQYPAAARKMEKGKRYAWIIKTRINGQEISESNVWTFKTATNYIATIDSVDISCSDSGAICFNFQVVVTNNNAPNAADYIGNDGEVYDLQVPGSSSVSISSPLGFPSSPHVLSYNASVTIMGKVCFSSFPSLPLKFRVSIRDQGNPNDHDAFTTKFVNTLPNCACDPCTDKTTTFGNPNDSSAITYQNNGSLSTASTVTHTPRHLLRVSAQIVDFQRLGEAGCLLCTNDSKQFGNYTGGSLNGSAGTIVNDEKGYGKLIEWEFPTPTLVSNFNYDLQMMFPPLAAVSCCKDSIRICTRWSFTDDKCITCDTLICSTIIREYKKPSKGPIYSADAARKQIDESVAKMGEPYVGWYKQDSDELPEEFTSQVQALYKSNEDKRDTDRIKNFENSVKAAFFALREMKKTATSSLWNAIQSNMLVSDMCGNGSFPDSVLDVTQWTGGYGIISNTTNDPMWGTYVSGFVPAANTGINQLITAGSGCFTGDQATQNHHTLVGPGDDPTVGNLLQTTSASTNPFSFRLGNSCRRWGSEYLAKTFVVGGSGIIRFMYALVMDGIHSLTANPSFHVKIFDANGILLPGRVFLDPMSPNTATDIIVSSSTDPFFQHSGTGSNKINYRDWSCATIDLSGDIGQQVTVVIITTDCAHGAHYGYAYIDDWCGNCEGATTGNVTINAIQDSCISRLTQVCVNYTLPTVGATTGSGTITLNFYQNGAQHTYSLTSPNLTTSGSHCFAIDPNQLSCNQGPGGYDVVATGNFTINTTPIVVTSPSPIGNPVQGIKHGMNNDLLCCNNPVDDCCTHFVKEVTTQISMPNTGRVLFTPTFKAGPKPIKQVRISVVNFETASSNNDCLVCESSAGLYGRMSVRMIPKNPIEGMNYPISIITLCLTCPPVWSALHSHEVTWGSENGQGYDLMDGLGDQSTQFTIVLPRQSTIDCCDDTVRICVKYSFMDIDCVTCDTIICYEIVNRQPPPSPWSKLNEKGILHGDDDPINLALNKGRQKLGQTVFGASIERWYADMNKQDWISKVITTRRSDVMSLLAVGRKLIEKNGVLERRDIAVVEKALRILDREIVSAPVGIIDETLKRLQSSIGMKWNQVLENVTR